jgi:hypothetical protein
VCGSETACPTQPTTCSDSDGVRHMAQPTTRSDLERIFEGICSSAPLDRSAAAAELTDLLEEQHSTEHHRRVGELIASAEVREQTGGLSAIAALLLIDGEDLGPRLSTYGGPLRTALLRLVGRPVNAAVLNQASGFYGELVRRCRDPDVLEAEVKSVFDVLADFDDTGTGYGGARGAGREAKPEARLLVAVLTLRQLTVHAPAAVYPHVATALEVLWTPLVSAAVRVRFAATDALYALLVLVAPRASRHLQQWHRQLLTGASIAFERDSNNANAVHGGMLALSCLLRVASSDFVLREVSLAGRLHARNRHLIIGILADRLCTFLSRPCVDVGRLSHHHHTFLTGPPQCRRFYARALSYVFSVIVAEDALLLHDCVDGCEPPDPLA